MVAQTDQNRLNQCQGSACSEIESLCKSSFSNEAQFWNSVSTTIQNIVRAYCIFSDLTFLGWRKSWGYSLSSEQSLRWQPVSRSWKMAYKVTYWYIKALALCLHWLVLRSNNALQALVICWCCAELARSAKNTKSPQIFDAWMSRPRKYKNHVRDLRGNLV